VPRMSAEVELVDDVVHVELSGVSGVLALKSHVEVPIANVMSAR
jgi:hypothetical protein